MTTNAAEGLEELIHAVQAVTEKISAAGGEAGTTTIAQIVTQTAATMNKAAEQFQLEGNQEGFGMVEKDIADAMNTADLRERARTWHAEDMWKDAHSFGVHAGIEVAKDILLDLGVSAVQTLFQVASQKKKAGGADAASLRKAHHLSSQLDQVGSLFRTVWQGWQLWLVGHYDERDSYGSVDVEGTQLSYFQIIQSEMALMDKTKVAPAFQAVAEQQSLASVQGLLEVYNTMLDKALTISGNIATRGQSMVKNGLQANQDLLNQAKTALAAAAASSA